MTPVRVAIVGGGIAGLSAARTLQADGVEVVVFDKGRAAGGRLATRRADAWAFDHGAQFFTARDLGFRDLVYEWIGAGHVAEWQGPFRTIEGGRVGPDPRPGAIRFVGTPSMSAVPRALAEGLDVRSGWRVESLVREPSGWRIAAAALPSSADGERQVFDGFDHVVLALPPEQALALLPPRARSGAVAEAAGRFAGAFQPCLCAMVALDAPLASGGGWFVVGDDVLSWAAHDGGKPGRAGTATFVLHGTPGWSAQRFDADPRENAAALSKAFARALAVRLPRMLHLEVHRWRYAQATGDALPVPFVRESSSGLALVGDALAGGRVEGAFVSGREVALAMLGRR